MAISAINCIPIKPQVNFGTRDYDRYNDLNNYFDEINDKFVKSDDIKSPIAIAASVALAALVSYSGARALTSAITSRFAPEMGIKVESALKFAGNTIRENAKKFAETRTEGELNKVQKFKDNALNLAGKAISKTEEGARSLYKKIAYSGIDESLANSEKANKALANAVGAGAATLTVADICTKDADEDGVKDIMQKSQNAYTGNKTKYNNAFEAVGVFSDLAQAFA